MGLKAWREKRKGERKTLPSGLDVTLRRVDLLDLAVQGGIPAPLMKAADKMLIGTNVAVQDFEAAEPVINLVVKACVVDPGVGDEGGGDQGSARELPVKDRLAIYNWANSGVAQLQDFGGEARAVTDAALAGRDLYRAETQRVAGG